MVSDDVNLHHYTKDAALELADTKSNVQEIIFSGGVEVQVTDCVCSVPGARFIVFV